MPTLLRSVLSATLVLAAASRALVLPGGSGQQAFSLPDAGHLIHNAADKATDVLKDSWNIVQGVARDAVSGKQCASLCCPRSWLVKTGG